MNPASCCTAVLCHIFQKPHLVPKLKLLLFGMRGVRSTAETVSLAPAGRGAMTFS